MPPQLYFHPFFHHTHSMPVPVTIRCFFKHDKHHPSHALCMNFLYTKKILSGVIRFNNILSLGVFLTLSLTSWDHVYLPDKNSPLTFSNFFTTSSKIFHDFICMNVSHVCMSLHHTFTHVSDSHGV